MDNQTKIDSMPLLSDIEMQTELLSEGGRGPVIWGDVRSKLRDVYGASTFDKWMSSLVFVAEVDGSVILATESKLDRERIERDYMRNIIGVWTALDPKTRPVTLVADADLPVDLKTLAKANRASQETSLQSVAPLSVVQSDEVEAEDFTQGVDLTQTFDTLVVGESNQLAANIARKVAAGIVGPVSVVLFYGAHGVGKTHLLRAIKHDCAVQGGKKSAVYMSAEDFMLTFVEGVRQKDTSAQRNRIRNADIVLLDDLQLITSRAATLKEFFQHLRAVIANGGKVVLSADAAPTRLECLDDRMRDDIQGGVVVEVHRPEIEMRAEIIRSKIEIIQQDFPEFELEEAWINLMAERLTASGRALYGAVRNVFAGTVLANKPVTEAAVENAIRLIVGERRAPKIDTIKDVVAKFYGITKADLDAASRRRNLAQPRQVAMYFCRELTTCSYPLIGFNFGKRDHTTVIYACRKVLERKEEEPDLHEELAKLQHQILDDPRNQQFT
ncbi:chromosomal replication initiator protein DnaA [Hirschia litorea]|uniref:Chromosomal replication initiator protein DnaA n=1 Tax=Hirschia litorea TaxID=1199156 RepID=A0ABW2INA5_9PROT